MISDALMVMKMFILSVLEMLKVKTTLGTLCRNATEGLRKYQNNPMDINI